MTGSNYNTVKAAPSLSILAKVDPSHTRKRRDQSQPKKKKSQDDKTADHEDRAVDAAGERPAQNDTEEHCIDFCA